MSKNNWKLHAVRTKAGHLGFEIKFVKRMFGPGHVQNRIYINGHRCHLMTTRHLISNGDGTIDLRVPENVWARFLIYVPEPVSENENSFSFYIIPRVHLVEGAFQNPAQLREYANAWYLLESDGARRRNESTRSDEIQIDGIPHGAVVKPGSNYHGEMRAEP